MRSCRLQPETLAQWWIPDLIECQIVKLDLRPGGGFETRMREETGDFQPQFEGCFLDIVPQQRLVWTTALAEGWRPAEPWQALTAIVTAKAGGRRYSCRAMHKNAADCRKPADPGFHDGWAPPSTTWPALRRAQGLIAPATTRRRKHIT